MIVSLWALRFRLESLEGIGRVMVGMARQGFDLQLTRYEKGWRRALLHDRDGALAHERDGRRVGADAVARDATGGVGSLVESGGGWSSMSPEERALQSAWTAIARPATGGLGYWLPRAFDGP